MDDHILLPGFRIDRKIQHLSSLDPPGNRGLIGGMEFERAVPFLGPGWQQQDLPPLGLHQHELKGLLPVASDILVGGVVVPLVPKGGELLPAVLVGEIMDDEFLGLIGKPKVGAIHRILSPAVKSFL